MAVIDGTNYAEGINTIKEINDSYFFMRLKTDMLIKWLLDNRDADGFIDLNIVRNNSEYFYAYKTDKFKKLRAV